jgi:hypothetical protein
MLGTISSDATSAGMPTIEQQAEIFMTWAQMKGVVLTLQTVLDIIESEVGPIPVPVAQGDQEAARDVIRTRVRNLNFPQRAQPQRGGPPS